MQLSQQERGIIKALAEELETEKPDIKLVAKILASMVAEVNINRPANQ